MIDPLSQFANNSGDKSFNSTIGNLSGNIELTGEIISSTMVKKAITAGGNIEEINIPLPAPGSNQSFILGSIEGASALRKNTTNSCNQTDESSVDSLTGIELSEGSDSLLPIIVQQALRSAQDTLKMLPTDRDFNAKMNLAFGDNWNPEVANSLVRDWLTGDFSAMPAIEIRASAEINNAKGAFASATNKIYLSRELVNQNATNPGAIKDVLLEETGHYIDSRINVSDAAGDEGDIFSRIVQGKKISEDELVALKAEDDTATVTLDGKTIQIEQAIVGNLSPTQTINGQLSTTDGANPTRSGSFADDYRLMGVSAGQQVQLDLSSTAFDSYLQLVNESTGQVIQFDDDSGGNLNSRLTFTAQSGINYLLRATSYGANSTGNYSLSAAGVYPVLSLNQTQSGQLSTTDRANPTRQGSFADDYRLTGFSVGQQVQLDMSTTAFDSYLQLVNESTGQVIQFDDDSGGNNNSRLTFTAQSGINYLVRSTSYAQNATGSYSLSAAGVNPLPTVTISATDASAGETTSGQTPNPGQFTFTRTGSTATALTVNYSVGGNATNGSDYSSLTGSLIIPVGASTAALPINIIDDTLVEGNETAVVTLLSNAAYTVGSTNSGTVTIADNDPTTVPISLNQTLSGTLSTADPSNPTRNGTYRDDYQLTGVSAGQQVRVNLNSSTFDNYLQVVNAATGQVLFENDDANGTNNAEVTFTVQSGVNYLLRATSYSASGTGNYTISASPVTPPTVTISATDASAGETTSSQTPNPGQFTITRTGSTTSALTVNYTIGGTASNGSDYSAISNNILIPVGSTSVTLPINVIDDSLVEGNETATITLASSSAYTLGSGNSATVTIADNDSTADWFDLNIRDSGLRSATRSRATDNILDRNDMIAIFRDAQDGSTIDSSELTDLRTIVSNSSRFNMQDYVRILSNKIANGDVANARYQGNSLGNLFAGSSSTQMENLIGKWFLGSDRPTVPSSYTYRNASGSLFQNGVSYQDIRQGTVGDCYFLAGLGATAFRTPSTIQNMFIDNGDNTYSVRFYNNGVADYVTVDRQLPTLSDINSTYIIGGIFTNLPYAQIGGRHDNPNNELWVALAEKAYAQINESAWIGQDNTNSYQGIESGSGYYSMRHVTGRNTSGAYFSTVTDTNAIINTFNAGQLVTISSKQPGSVASDVVGNHEYVMVGYNSSNQTFTLFNPWGVNNGTSQPGLLYFTPNQITASFNYWAYTTTVSGQQQLRTADFLPPPEIFT